MDDARYQLIDGQTTYVYDPKQNGELAAQCWSRFARAMMDPIVGTIVVDNTHTTKWQWEPFVMTAKIGGARVSVVDFVTDSVAVAKILASRNKHSAPLGAILNQIATFEPTNREDDVVDDHTQFNLTTNQYGEIKVEKTWEQTLEMVNILAEYTEAVNTEGRDSTDARGIYDASENNRYLRSLLDTVYFLKRGQ
jgi:hypothetical protein